MFHAFDKGNFHKFLVASRVLDHSYREHDRITLEAEDYLADTCDYLGVLSCDEEKKDLTFEDYMKSYSNKSY